jgi:hypothetical protein
MYKKILIFPYDVDHYELAVSLKIMGLDIELGIQDDSQLLNKTLNYTRNIESCDDLEFVKISDINPEAYSHVLLLEDEVKLSTMAKSKIKNIFQVESFQDKRASQGILKILSDKSNYNNINQLNEDTENYLLRDQMLHTCDTPVIFVAGAIDNRETYIIGKNMEKQMKLLGCKVAFISQNDLSNYGLSIPFPKQFRDEKTKIEDQMTYLNFYLKSIEINYKPDLIIIEIPSGILYNPSTRPNNFGINFKLISTVVLPDYMIISSPVDYYNRDFYNELASYCKNITRKTIDVFHLGNAFINSDLSNTYAIESPVYLSDAAVKESFMISGMKSVANTIKYNDDAYNYKAIAQDVIKKLS